MQYRSMYANTATAAQTWATTETQLDTLAAPKPKSVVKTNVQAFLEQEKLSAKAEPVAEKPVKKRRDVHDDFWSVDPFLDSGAF